MIIKDWYLGQQAENMTLLAKRHLQSFGNVGHPTNLSAEYSLESTIETASRSLLAGSTEVALHEIPPHRLGRILPAKPLL